MTSDQEPNSVAPNAAEQIEPPVEREPSVEALLEEYERTASENREAAEAWILRALDVARNDDVALETKKQIEKSIGALKRRYPVEKERKKEPDDTEVLFECVRRIPDARQQTRILGLLESIPVHQHKKYGKHLHGCLDNPNPVGAYTGIEGTIFELSRGEIVKQQALEQLDSAERPPVKVSYYGYDEKLKKQMEAQARIEAEAKGTPVDAAVAAATSAFYQIAPSSPKEDKGIDFDTPIIRDGKPYMYEAKSCSRMVYGSTASNRDQLLKYQTAITKQLISGATVEVRGRLDPAFMKWAVGKGIGDPGAVPDVEILYTLELPSGAEHRFPVKRVEQREGLHFHDQKRGITPESTLVEIKEQDPERYRSMTERFGNDDAIVEQLRRDRHVINGVQRAMRDRSIERLLSDVNIKNPPPELEPYLKDPTTIDSMDVYRTYSALRSASIWEALESKREIINKRNANSAVSENMSRGEVERQIRMGQENFTRNPELAKVKKAYILSTEEQIVKVTDAAMSMVEKIRAFELARAADESRPDNDARAHRAALGYVGQPEGVALDVEHIIMDAIQETNAAKGKVGRSYEKPERFLNPQQIVEYLKHQETRRYREIVTFDPLSSATETATNITDEKESRLELALLKENIDRAQRFIESARTATEPVVDKLQNAALLRGYEMNQKRISNMKERITALQLEKTERIRAEKDVALKKELSAQFDAKTTELLREITTSLQQVFGGQEGWERIAKRIVQKTDQNIIKFIYAVNKDGVPTFGEEVVRGDASGRAAHSELNQGRNSYGAGEAAWEKQGDQWVLIEINNGSGHYRPSSDILPYVKNVFQGAGIDTSHALLKDSLMRGAAPPDMTLLED